MKCIDDYPFIENIIHKCVHEPSTKCAANISFSARIRSLRSHFWKAFAIFFFGYLSIITVFLHYTVIIFIIAANSNRLKVLYFHYAVNKQSLKEEKRISVLFWICFLIWCAFFKNLLSPSLLLNYLSRLKYIFGICLRVCKCVWANLSMTIKNMSMRLEWYCQLRSFMARTKTTLLNCSHWH